MGKVKVYNKDTLCAELEYSNKDAEVLIKNYTSEAIHLPLGKRDSVPWENFYKYLTNRCFPEERRNKKELLKILGVPEYDPFAIIKKTQGRMAEDDTWLIIED